MDKIKQMFQTMGAQFGRLIAEWDGDRCVFIGKSLSQEELLEVLHTFKTLTVILEPQERLTSAIYGYDLIENKLIYDTVKLAKCFDIWWGETDTPTSEKPCDRMDSCFQWVYYNCDVGVHLKEIKESWELWQ